ncbi:MAG: cytochrome c [bacterium]|nr:cytochrome c [bacterium]
MKNKALIALMALLPVACGGSDTPAAPALDAAAVAAGKKVYTDNGCDACHGDTGKGDTPTGQAFDPSPRDYSNAEWQDKTSDEQLRKVINEGGAANGMAATMIPYPTIQEADLDNLVTFIRSLKK